MRLAAILTVSLPLLLGGCVRYEPIDNIDRAMPSNAQHLSQNQIRDVIVHAVHQFDWDATPIEPGHLEAIQNHGQLSATVEIYYTPARLQITLKSSKNLFQTATTVHAHYNLWVRNIEKEIIDELTVAP